MFWFLQGPRRRRRLWRTTLTPFGTRYVLVHNLIFPFFLCRQLQVRNCLGFEWTSHICSIFLLRITEAFKTYLKHISPTYNQFPYVLESYLPRLPPSDPVCWSRLCFGSFLTLKMLFISQDFFTIQSHLSCFSLTIPLMWRPVSSIRASNGIWRGFLWTPEQSCTVSSRTMRRWEETGTDWGVKIYQ